MTYTKQTWTDGEVITAEKLNHIEDGVGNTNAIIFNVDSSLEDDIFTYTLDKTYSEIKDCVESGNIPLFVLGGSSQYDKRFLYLYAMNDEVYDDESEYCELDLLYVAPYNSTMDVSIGMLRFESDDLDGVLQVVVDPND